MDILFKKVVPNYVWVKYIEIREDNHEAMLLNISLERHQKEKEWRQAKKRVIQREKFKPIIESNNNFPKEYLTIELAGDVGYN